MFASGKWFAVALLALGVAACDESPVTLPQATSIPAAAAELQLTVGDVATLPNQVLDQQGQVMPSAQPSFTSDKPSVASVDRTGTVRAMAAGVATITAAYGGVTAASKVTVAARPAPTPTSILMPSGELSLTVGDGVTLPGQVLDQNGQVMQGLRPAYSSSNPSVVSVDGNGAVRAVSTGSAEITAAYGGVRATTRVTVSNDERSFVRSLNVQADSVAADVRVGLQAVSMQAFDGFGRPVCPPVTIRVDDPSVAFITQDGCRLNVQPRFEGRTLVTVFANGVSDTFVVNVTSRGMVAVFSSRPATAALFAGNTVSYSVRVLDETGAGIPNRRVAFDVAAGTLAASSATTDSSGVATVQWALPTNLRQLGSTQTISFSTVLPNGVVVTRNESVFINGAPATTFTLYRLVAQKWEPITTSSITAPRYSFLYLGARAEDQYGNLRVQDYTLTVSGPSTYLCGSDYTPSEGIRYACVYHYGSPTPGNATFTASGGGTSRSVQITFQ